MTFREFAHCAQNERFILITLLAGGIKTSGFLQRTRGLEANVVNYFLEVSCEDPVGKSLKRPKSQFREIMDNIVCKD